MVAVCDIVRITRSENAIRRQTMMEDHGIRIIVDHDHLHRSWWLECADHPAYVTEPVEFETEVSLKEVQVLALRHYVKEHKLP